MREPLIASLAPVLKRKVGKKKKEEEEKEKK